MMKMKWKQTLAILLAAALSLAATGCALKDKKASDSDASASAYSEKELAKVAVKVGEKYTVTKGDIVDQYNYMVQMYTSYGMSAPTADADIESMQDSVVSSLVSDKIQLYETDLMGITLTDKEKADVEAKVEEEMKYYTDSFRSQAVDEGAADPDARALEIFQEQLDSAGMDMDVDGFRAYVTDQYTNEALKAALKAKVTVDVTATDEEIKTYYDTNLATQQDSFTKTPADFLSAAESAQEGSGDPVLYAPEGYVRVRTITVSPEGDLTEEYTTLKSDLDALAAKYGAAALDALAAKYAAQGADPAATSLDVATGEIEGGADIVKEYLEKKAQADVLYEAYVKDARTKAEEAYTALQGGTSFTDAMTKYGEDTLYTQYPTFVETGLLMYPAGDDYSVWDKKLVDAVGLLKAGEYSAVIQVGDMFYIVQLVGSEPAGVKTLADAHDAIKAAITKKNADTLWESTLSGWENDTSIATYYKDVYRDIGKK